MSSFSRAAMCAALLVPVALSAQHADVPDAVAAAERAFARMSVDSGQWAAFHEYLDTASVIFRPRATPGKAWYASHRPPSPTGGPVLFWTPAHVGVAASGDLAFSTGPFRTTGVRPGTRDTVRRGGSFATVWGRRPGEPWRVLVDLGVTSSSVPDVDSTRAPTVAKVGDRQATATTAIAADSALGANFDTFARVLADDGHVLRDGGAAAGNGDGYRSAPQGGAVARSGDLAYTYGTYTRAATATSAAEAGNYLRVWRRGAGRWRIVLDVASPVPAT